MGIAPKIFFEVKFKVAHIPEFETPKILFNYLRLRTAKIVTNWCLLLLFYMSSDPLIWFSELSRGYGSLASACGFWLETVATLI